MCDIVLLLSLKEFQMVPTIIDAFMFIHTYVFSKIFVAVSSNFTGRYWYGTNMQRNPIICIISDTIL